MSPSTADTGNPGAPTQAQDEPTTVGPDHRTAPRVTFTRDEMEQVAMGYLVVADGPTVEDKPTTPVVRALGGRPREWLLLARCGFVPAIDAGVNAEGLVLPAGLPQPVTNEMLAQALRTLHRAGVEFALSADLADSTPMPLNAELMRAVLKHITACPKEWHQAAWRCGSAFCFGGWAALLHGAVLAEVVVREEDDFREDYDEESEPEDVEVVLDDAACDRLHLDRSVGRERRGLPISEYARLALGLTEKQANLLFDGDNTLQDLNVIVDTLTAGYPEVTTAAAYPAPVGR